MFTENSFSDVTLVSDDQIPFQAHKFVLSIFTPVLKTILLNNIHSHPLIFLRGVMQQDLKSILQLMYLGLANVSQDNISKVLAFTKDLQIRELEEIFGSIDNNTYVKDDTNCSLESTANNSDNIDSEMDTSSISNNINEPPSIDILVENNNIDDHGSGNLLYMCKECDSTFTSRSGFVYHIKIKHEGIKHPCNNCKYKAGDKSTLRKN